MYSQQLGAQANNMGTLDEISLYICISLYAYIVLCWLTGTEKKPCSVKKNQCKKENS